MFDNIEFRPSKNGYIRVNCPYCITRIGKADTKFTMSVNTRKNSYFCFRCGYSSKTGGISNKLKDLIDTIGEKSGDPMDLYDKVQDLEYGKRKDNFIKLEKISEPIDYSDVALEYLRSRGITDEEISKYNIRLGTQGRWANRILFPLLDNKSRCIYVVGRDLTGESDKRYLNSPSPKSKYMYGVDQVGSSNTVILTEGVISGIAASRQTGVPWVCLLGKAYSSEQLEHLRSKVSNVIVSLDGGVDYRKLASSLIFKRFKVELVELPEGTDPDDLSGDYMEYFNNRRPISIKDVI